MFIGLALVITLEAIGLGLESTYTQLKSLFDSATAAAS
jgi:hypothetical protein